MASRKRSHFEKGEIAPNAMINKQVEATPQKRFKKGEYLLNEAIQQNNIVVVQHFLEKQTPKQFSKMMNAPMTPLHFAAELGNLEVVKLFFNNGYNKSKSNKRNRETPLHFAVKKNHIEVVKFLIENGFKSELSNQEYHQLIRQCILSDRLEMVKCLINNAEGTNEADSTSETLLHCAAANGRLDILNYLIECGADIKMRTDDNETPLHYAIKAGHVDIVKKLLNTKVEKTGYDLLINDLAVHLAAENGNEEIFQMLLKAGFSMGCSLKNRKPIHVAAAFGHLKLVSLLIENGVDIDSATDGKTSLHFAIASGHFSVVKYLLDAGANPTGVSEYIAWTLHYVLDKERWISNDFDLKFEKRVKILRYLLNYFPEDKLESILYSNIEYAFLFQTPVELVDVLLEYNVKKKIENSNSYIGSDINSFVHIIDHNENIVSLYFLLMGIEHSAFKTDDQLAEQYLKIIFSRIVLMLSIEKNFNIEEVLKMYKFRLPNEYYINCENEISIMKEEKIDNDFDVTYYDILTKSVDKVANYMRSKKFVQSLGASYKKFSEYAVFLERNIEKGKERENLIDSSVNSLFNLVEKNHKIELPNLVVMKIFDYLQVIHLRKLEAAFS